MSLLSHCVPGRPLHEGDNNSCPNGQSIRRDLQFIREYGNRIAGDGRAYAACSETSGAGISCAMGLRR